MDPVSSCPDPRQWQRLLCERLPDDEAKQLEQHLSECPACLQTVRGVRSEGDDFLAPPQQPDEIGRLGQYRVLRVLGSGGMGVVFEAEDPDLQRKVALKVMRPWLAADEAARKRFLREARAAAALDHDHIVKIFQVGEDRGVPFIAMQLLRGQSLQNRLRDGDRLPSAEVVRIGRELAEGLAAGHEAGLVHRDVKPANVWLEEPRGRVKVLDFGLARPEREDAQLTRSGTVAGTPAFMAPEQARGLPIDGRCDLFSVGCVLYRLLTGEAPFKGANTMAVLLSLAEDQPAPPHLLNPEAPPELSDLVMRLLSKDPAGRPPSARAVVEALDKIGRDATVQPPAPRRRPLVALAAGLLAAVALFAGIVIIISARHGNKVVEDPVPPGGSFTTAPADPFPLARLDRAKIPAEDRFDCQPKELVAVAGEHALRALGPVTGVAYSGDGKLIASGGSDGYLYLWDAATMRRLAMVPAPKFGGDRIAFHPKRPLLVCVGGNYGLLRLLDVSDPAKPKEVGQALAPPAGTTFGAPAFSPGGEFLAVPGTDGLIRLWDVKGDPKELPPLKGHEGAVNRVAFPVAGAKAARVLFSQGADETIRRWDLGGDSVEGRIVLRGFKVAHALAASPDAKLLALGPNATWRLWNVSGAEPSEVEGSQKAQSVVWAAAFSGDGRWAATGSTTGFDVWNLLVGSEGPSVASIPQTNLVNAVAFSPDSQTVVTGGQDGTVRQWALRDDPATERFPLHGHTDRVLAVGFGAGDRTLYSASPDGTVRSWDMAAPAPKEQRVLALKDGPRHVPALAVAGPRPRVAMYDSRGGGNKLWDLGGQEPKELDTIAEQTMLALSTDGSAAAYAARTATNEKVVVLDLRGGKAVKQEIANGSPVSVLALSADGRFLACGGPDSDKPKSNVVRVWDLAAKAKPKLLNPVPAAFTRGTLTVLGFSPDARTLAAGGTEAGLQFWELTPDDKVPLKNSLVITDGSPWRMLAFSPDGKLLAAATAAGRLVVLDKTDGWSQRQEWEFPAPVGSMAFAGDGRHLAIGNANGTVSILRLPAEKE
jgi:WD40 repeat protein